MARSSVVLACLSASLAGCILLGPGASDDDDDEETDTSSFDPGGSVIVASPTAGTSAPNNVTGWLCSETTTECRCNQLSFNSTADGRCRYDWSCCVHMPAAAQCRCYSDDSCAAVVASMQGAELVPTCPPNAELIPEACADADENCTQDYLEQQGLHGCCDGLVCKVDDQNVRVCQPGSDAEQAAEALCLDERTQGLIVAGPVTTTAGDLPFTIAGSLSPEISASGCPIQIPLGLSVTADVVSSAFCSLRLVAGPDRDAEGRLLVHNLELYAESVTAACAGFPPGVRGLYMQGGAMAGTLAFEGASCESSIGSEVCIAGHMVLTLDATLTGTSVTSSDPTTEPVAVTFAGAIVELDGRICDIVPAMTACPAQP